ncbi:MAG: zinc dependent phospholipase C family protein [Eubacteriales bacterium]|nr:zinc dependent phospholipase C family protein [Eubacteriales bacterium]
MPGFTTHYIIGIKSLSEFPPGAFQDVLKQHRYIYQLGLQGPDIFFYNIPLARHRNHRNIGVFMHEAHIETFFRTLFLAISDIEDDQKRGQAIAYAAGYICHYVGDSIIHPYVYARIGHDPKQKGSEKSRTTSLHCQLENDIDAILLYRYRQKRPSEFNQATSILLSPSEKKFLSQFLSSVITKAYYPSIYDKKYYVSPGVVARSIWATQIGCRMLSDPLERKKQKINYIETLLGRSPIVSNKLVTDSISDMRWALNSEHEYWANPWDRSLVSSQSFPELFQIALGKCRDCFFQLSQLSEKPLPWSEEDIRPLLTVLGNYSFHSGLPVG